MGIRASLMSKESLYCCHYTLSDGGGDGGLAARSAARDICRSHYAAAFGQLRRFEEARSLMRKTIPAAQRVLGDNDRLTLKMRRTYAMALYNDPGATLDDLREAVTTLEDSQRIARRVFGGAHPLTMGIEDSLQEGEPSTGSVN